jgi:hypothetical protein
VFHSSFHYYYHYHYHYHYHYNYHYRYYYYLPGSIARVCESDVTSAQFIHEPQHRQSIIEGVTALYRYQAGNLAVVEGLPYVCERKFTRKRDRRKQISRYLVVVYLTTLPGSGYRTLSDTRLMNDGPERK